MPNFRNQLIRQAKMQQNNFERHKKQVKIAALRKAVKDIQLDLDAGDMQYCKLCFNKYPKRVVIRTARKKYFCSERCSHTWHNIQARRRQQQNKTYVRPEYEDKLQLECRACGLLYNNEPTTYGGKVVTPHMERYHPYYEQYLTEKGIK